MKLDLIDAVVQDDVEKVRGCLQKGAIPNGTEDSDGITALHLVATSASENALPIATLLVEAGADPHAKTSEELTPLDVARLHGNTEMKVFFKRFSVVPCSG